MTTKIPEHFDMGSCEIYLAASKADSCFGGRWVVMLSSHVTGTYDVYYSTGSPSATGNGYEQKQASDLKIKDRDDLFIGAIYLGCFQVERLNRFIKVFKRTIPGPDQFFAVLWEPRYSEAERKYYDDNLSPVDYLFYTTDVKESGHLVPKKTGPKFPYIFPGCTEES
ncbi:uncharacterized protein APUU_61375A [Aspergillus puulaauensis]|uniref:Uncharacterized protein n=1 Tax=Aspergillus puulaauensis TaxID=1220207 RepID=A0A7R7XV60_9EURO|nr:uncharacterized protein APUU_61375A [Aspergillus puulaauensis]BCS28327.1 hypothetical protein APUU_61375A [Aspergillus puulaauensis]